MFGMLGSQRVKVDCLVWFGFFCLFFLVLHFNKIPIYGVLMLSIGGGILAALLVQFLVSPYLKKKILREVYGNGDDVEGMASPSQGSTVSFTKSKTVSEREVDSNEKNDTGR